ncbi:glutathione S-transferase 1-1-like [Periplaneta americana]|uniref:glutathione S-transferase 1-1-like n=1 Tax=Periplaneta americana TaxID=6978 RepID=UPI0037E7F121
MKIDLYYSPGSPPCRVVLLLGKALGLNFNLKSISVQAKENMTPEYLKINPQHCIPTIVDNGLILWESRAIITYLADRYGKDDSLYPKDLKKRALVDQRLYFDMGTLVSSMRQYFTKKILGSKLEADDITKLENAFELLDKFLEGEEWVAGSNITVADYAIVVNVSITEAFGSRGLDFDISKYHNVTRWFSNAKKTMVGFSEIEGKGIEESMKRIDALRAQRN